MWAIISNSCWAEPCYRQFGLGYNTPTIGLWFYADDYIAFLSDLRNILRKPLHFTDQPRRAKPPYPVASLTDRVEVQFQHFKSEQEAREKWERRVARMPVSDEDLRIRICDRDGLEQHHIDAFAELAFKHKVGFFKKGRFNLSKYDWAVEMDCEGETIPSGVIAYDQAIAQGFPIQKWLEGNNINDGSP